jgi:hypothetical protein
VVTLAMGEVRGRVAFNGRRLARRIWQQRPRSRGADGRFHKAHAFFIDQLVSKRCAQQHIHMHQRPAHLPCPGASTSDFRVLRFSSSSVGPSAAVSMLVSSSLILLFKILPASHSAWALAGVTGATTSVTESWRSSGMMIVGISMRWLATSMTEPWTTPASTRGGQYPCILRNRIM